MWMIINQCDICSNKILALILLFPLTFQHFDYKNIYSPIYLQCGNFWVHRKVKLSGNVLRHVSLNTLKPQYPSICIPVLYNISNFVLMGTPNVDNSLTTFCSAFAFCFQLLFCHNILPLILVNAFPLSHDLIKNNENNQQFNRWNIIYFFISLEQFMHSPHTTIALVRFPSGAETINVLKFQGGCISLRGTWVFSTHKL